MSFFISISNNEKLLDIEEIHEYVLAKLEFLLILFRNKEKVIQNQVALIVQFLPDFFYYVFLIKN